MNFKLSQTLNAKLSIAFILLVTTVLSLFGIYNYSGLKSDLYDGLEREVEGIAQRLGKSLPAPIWDFSEINVIQIMESEMISPSVTSIIISSGDNISFARTKDKNNEIVETDTIPELGTYSSTISRDLILIEDDSSKKVGVLDLYITDKLIQKNLQLNLIKQIVQIIILDLILVAFQTFIFAKLVARPLGEVNGAVHDIAEGEGDLRQRLDAKTKDELGTLAMSFNKFIGGLQSIIKQVMECSQELSENSETSAEIAECTRDDLERQRAEMSSLATAVNEMAASAREVAKSASNAAKSTDNAKDESKSGKEVVDKTVASIHALANEVQVLYLDFWP